MSLKRTSGQKIIYFRSDVEHPDEGIDGTYLGEDIDFVIIRHEIDENCHCTKLINKNVITEISIFDEKDK